MNDQSTKVSLVEAFSKKYSVEPAKMLSALKATAFKGNVTDEQMIALLVVANQYGLNPFTKEIYAYPSNQGIVPGVGIDGWARIINSDSRFDGMDFEQDDEKCLCKIYRKDRSHAISVTEYMTECNRGTPPWKSHPKRMLRHKAMIQCARIAFGFVGIYDEDEGEFIASKEAVRVDPRGDLSNVDSTLVEKHINSITDILNSDVDEYEMASILREYVEENLQKYNELYISVNDELANRNIITKAQFKKMLKLEKPIDVNINI